MQDTVQDVHVQDILSLVVSQPGGPGADTTVISEYQPNPLSSKDCNVNADGICNVNIQLPAKYFVGTDPNNLQLHGIARLSFNGGRRRQLATALLDTSRWLEPEEPARNLAKNEASAFTFEVELEPYFFDNEAHARSGDGNTGVDNTIILIAILVVVGCLVMGSLLVGTVCYRTKRQVKVTLQGKTASVVSIQVAVSPSEDNNLKTYSVYTVQYVDADYANQIEV